MGKSAWVKYTETVAETEKKQRKAIEALEAEYAAATRPAWEAYVVARRKADTVYEKVRAPAWKVREAAIAPEYKEMVACRVAAKAVLKHQKAKLARALSKVRREARVAYQFGEVAK